MDSRTPWRFLNSAANEAKSGVGIDSTSLKVSSGSKDGLGIVRIRFGNAGEKANILPRTEFLSFAKYPAVRVKKKIPDTL